MHSFLKVEGNDSLIRDIDTKAIINTNKSDYDNYLKRKNHLKSQNDEIKQNTNDINTIKQELCEIKELLLLSLKLKDNNGNH